MIIPFEARGPYRSILFLLMLALPAGGSEPVTIQASADTTLSQYSPDNSFGGAAFFNAGSNGSFTPQRNRGLIKFDIAGMLPAASIVTSVELTLNVTREPSVQPAISTFFLQRVLRPWGEGTQEPDPNYPGLGTPAMTGDATWNDRFFGMSSPWGIPGGAPGIDFSGAVSGQMEIGGNGTGEYTFPAEPGMIADVQYWLEHPESNFGWLLSTDQEGTHRTARSFGSREDPLGQGPFLNVQFEPVPEPGTFVIGMAACLVVLTVRRQSRT